MKKYCVYARPGHWLGFLFTWKMVHVTDSKEYALTFGGGYCQEAAVAGHQLMAVEAILPLTDRFYFLPAGWTRL